MWWSLPTAFVFLATASIAERTLPTEVQVDLLFPRNETYAPTEWFPIVLAIRNLDAVWPLEVDLQADVFSMGSQRNQSQHVSWQNVGLYWVPTPEKHYFHIPAINLTNGATDRYNIVWRLRIWNRCFGEPNRTEERSWTNDPAPYRMQKLSFSTAPGAAIPDVEASVSSCRDPTARDSAAVHISQVRDSLLNRGKPCPVLEDIPPEKCIYKPLAKQFAASVKTIVDKKRCGKGALQTVSPPCQHLTTSASSHVVTPSWMSWALVALVFATWI